MVQRSCEAAAAPGGAWPATGRAAAGLVPRACECAWRSGCSHCAWRVSLLTLCVAHPAQRVLVRRTDALPHDRSIHVAEPNAAGSGLSWPDRVGSPGRKA